jgi:hypothetical protein
LLEFIESLGEQEMLRDSLGSPEEEEEEDLNALVELVKGRDWADWVKWRKRLVTAASEQGRLLERLTKTLLEKWWVQARFKKCFAGFCLWQVPNGMLLRETED